MGFTYDPSTAGSSVRFDPPDPRDAVSVVLYATAILLMLPVAVKPITFHRRELFLLSRSLIMADYVHSAPRPNPPTSHAEGVWKKAETLLWLV